MKFKWKGGGANLNENVQDSLETVNLKSSSNRNQVTSHLVGIRNSIIVSVVLKSSPVRDASQKKANFGTSAQRGWGTGKIPNLEHYHTGRGILKVHVPKFNLIFLVLFFAFHF